MSNANERHERLVRRFGNWVYLTRRAKRMTLEEVANLAGTSKSLIWEIENNSPDVRLSTICGIADAFGIKPETVIRRAMQ